MQGLRDQAPVESAPRPPEEAEATPQGKEKGLEMSALLTVKKPKRRRFYRHQWLWEQLDKILPWMQTSFYDVKQRDGPVVRVRQYEWWSTAKKWVFWKPYGWVRSRNQWLSHFLFMPSRQFSRLAQYDARPTSNKRDFDVVSHLLRESMRFSIPPKYRDKVQFTDLPPDPESPDPFQRPGYAGWKYNPPRR